MKTAMLISAASVDASEGFLSAWETQVTQTLQRSAGFHPDKTLCLWPDKRQSPWEGKPFGPPTPALQEAMERVRQELNGFDTCLTLGALAMWALTGESKIDTFRGCHIDSPFVPGLQVIPTYDQEVYARRAWHERPIVGAAMLKARQRYTEIKRQIFIPQTPADLWYFSTKYIGNEFAFDVETNVSCRITEFSLAPANNVCLYVKLEEDNQSIWSEADERDILLWLHYLAARQDITWIFHNATYDLTYLDAYGIRPAGHIADTMLRHHAGQPEFEKSLGFLAQLYLPTRAWKYLRTRPKHLFNKAGSL